MLCPLRAGRRREDGEEPGTGREQGQAPGLAPRSRNKAQRWRLDTPVAVGFLPVPVLGRMSCEFTRVPGLRARVSSGGLELPPNCGVAGLPDTCF